MERSMLIDQKTQYCENGYTTESDLYVQWRLLQNSKDILHRYRKISVKVPMETQKASIPKAILSKKNNAGGNTICDFNLYHRPIVIKTA
jgi:hypothetical protein